VSPGEGSVDEGAAAVDDADEPAALIRRAGARWAGRLEQARALRSGGAGGVEVAGALSHVADACIRLRTLDGVSAFAAAEADPSVGGAPLTPSGELTRAGHALLADQLTAFLLARPAAVPVDPDAAG
jgi:hypothetical protein